MKMYFLILILFSSLSWSQKWPSNEYAVKYNYIEVIGDTVGVNQKLIKPRYAMYPNGKNGINKLITDKIKYPNTKEKPKNNGKVVLGYFIEKDGTVGDIKVLQSAGESFDKEAIRVLKKMERWIPAQNDGEIVRIYYTQPFRFQ